MKKQVLVIGIIALLVSVGFSGCDQTSNPLDIERNKFIGTWNITQGMKKGISLTFFSDGTGSLGIFSMTWVLKDGKLVIYVEGVAAPYNYSFTNNDRQLTLVESGSNVSEVFTKQ
jgi:hypothetical protein